MVKIKKGVAFETFSPTSLLDFPKLNEDQLKILFSGSYQLSMAVSYFAEILDDSSKICAKYVKKTPSMIKFEVQSRHISGKVYHVLVDYSPNHNSVKEIKRYCCSCPNKNEQLPV